MKTVKAYVFNSAPIFPGVPGRVIAYVSDIPGQQWYQLINGKWVPIAKITKEVINGVMVEWLDWDCGHVDSEYLLSGIHSINGVPVIGNLQEIVVEPKIVVEPRLDLNPCQVKESFENVRREFQVKWVDL